VRATPLGRPATLAWVALGGTLGTAVRYAAVQAAGPPSGWPYVTFAVNLIGSFLLGWLVEALPRHERPRLFAGTGFCGGLTTYSTFAVELAILGRDHRFGLAAGYLLASVLGGLAAAAAGASLGRRFDGTPSGRTT
jgi:CrcB protein